MRKLYISKSAIDDFLACEKRYYYRLHYKDKAVPSREMFLGTLVHEILEKHTDSFAGAMDQVDKLTGQYDLVSKDRDVLGNSVQGFFDSFHHLITPDDQTEVMFTVPYTSNVFLVGKYDRITPTHMVIDWKSGTYVPFTLKNDVQSILYSYAYKQEFGVEPTVVMAYLRSNKMSTYLKDNLYVDILFNEVLPDMMDTILSGKLVHSGLFKGSCRRCSFKEFCFEEMEK